MILSLGNINVSFSDLLQEYMGVTGSLVIEFILKCVLAILILVIGFRLVKYVVKLCDRVFTRYKMDPMLHSFLLSVLRIGLRILLIFMAIIEVGVAASSLVAVIGSCALALGLSLQGSLSNIAGGVILLFLKPFEVDDYIIEESSGKEGTVQSIGIMYTKLISPDNQVILVPNGNLSNASITNMTQQEKRRVQLSVSVEYKADIKKVKDILTEVLENEPALLKEEPVNIFVSEFKESCIAMGLWFWVKTEDYRTSQWNVLEQIKYAFDENGITIPFAQLDVNINEQETKA